MKLNELDQISDAIETICKITCKLTDTDINQIIDNLIGITWNKEDASKIKEYLGINNEETTVKAT